MKRLIAPVLILILLVAGTAAFTQSFQVSLGMSKGPQQPIKFDHQVHAGKLQMDCLYCHYAADKSAAANIPTITTCMGCHKVAATDRPEVQKLAKLFAENRAPEWVEVYNLPDHVKFNHKRHVKAEIKCQDCHGPVQEMSVMYQYPSLKMGWCLECHRRNLNHEKYPATMDCLSCHH